MSSLLLKSKSLGLDGRGREGRSVLVSLDNIEFRILQT